MLCTNKLEGAHYVAATERQEALEELAVVVTTTPIDLDRIDQIKHKLRSLEGK